MTKKDKTGVDRRGFLKSVGTGAAGAATIALGAGVATPAAASENAAERKKKRYKESEHVKAYYRTNRY